MRLTPYMLVIIPAMTLIACSGVGTKSQVAEEIAATDSTSFANDITPLNSASRKRVRTANIRCRVNNVFKVTSELEHTVLAVGGVIVESTIQNIPGREQDLPYSTDSLKHVQLYTPTANLTLRVPVQTLDSVVATLAPMSSFIDSRSLKSDDKTWAYLSNSLKNQPSADVEGTVKNKLEAQKYEDQKNEATINRTIANMGIMDDVNYSTFTVELFQPQFADVQITVDPDRIVRAGFGTEIGAALRMGTDSIRNVFLFFVQLWPFILLSIGGWIIYKRYSRTLVKSGN